MIRRGADVSHERRAGRVTRIENRWGTRLPGQARTHAHAQMHRGEARCRHRAWVWVESIVGTLFRGLLS